MVQNILFYAKERNLQWETVDVHSFAEDVSLMVEHKILQQGIQFGKNLGSDLGRFEIDAGVVRSALLNILENAIEATLAAKDNPDLKITFGVQKEKNSVVFTINDNGIGMDAETRENMFTLFFSSKGHAGTGLGLYIADRIIKQHGGYIKVDSAPGKGSHFRITLPDTLPASAKHLMKNRTETPVCT